MTDKPAYEELEQRIRELEQEAAEHKQVQEVLRDSEERYCKIFNAAADGMVVVDGEGIILDANNTYCRMYGYSYEELKGNQVRDVIHPDHHATFIECRRQIDETGSAKKTESMDVCKDGRTVPIDIHAVMFSYKGKPAYLGVLRDITERKGAEVALRESEKKYRTILETIEEGYWESDMGGSLTFFNASMCRILGYAGDELLGMPYRQVTDEKSTEIAVQALNKVCTTGKPARGFEYEIIRKDGVKRYVESSASLIIDSGGQPIGFRGIIRDITDKKVLEAQFRQAQKMESVGTLAGGIAHDFNNLLMGILGNASIILLDIDPDHPHYERLKGIEQHVQSGADLTGQLLGFARGGKYEVRPANLNEVIKKSSAMFARTKKEIKIHMKYQEDIWSVEVDQGQIEQALLNLYVNAWQAMPGGGDLYLQTENTSLDENYVKPYGVEPGRYVKILVTDTGVGMDEATRQRIFDPFFTTKDMGRGTGLGMASVYGIIKNHGGIIAVYSEKGVGTTFNIYLPVSEKQVIGEKEFPEETLKGSETILLVDDEDMIIDVGREILKTLGYKVLQARDGKEALEIVKKGHTSSPDLIILDMIMPGMGGGEVYDRMKEIDPGVKVLLSSGYSIDGRATEILERGCNGFIQKPFSMKHLSQKIREILGREA